MAIQRGEIYFVNLNPVQGREQAGSRPVLVRPQARSREPCWKKLKSSFAIVSAYRPASAWSELWDQI